MRLKGLAGEVRRLARRTGDFFGREAWEARLEDLSAGDAARIKAARVVYCTVQGLFLGDSMHISAAALTYFSVLSIVPLLAFVFALLKGFGAYDALVEQSIRPYVSELLAANEPLRRAFEQILDFVAETGVTSLGFMGLLALMYAARRLLFYIEKALNELWSADRGRDALEQLRDYLAIIVVTPISMIAAAALGTTGQVLNLLRAAGERLGLAAVVEGLIGIVGPLLVVFVGLAFLYMVMPHAKVHLRSALLGAAVAGVVWYGVLILHVRFQVGVARFNALYAGFGAIPIFLVWLQLSWLIVLVGGQIAATHQRSQWLAERRRAGSVDSQAKEVLGLAAALDVTRHFLEGKTPPTEGQLSQRFAVPPALLREVMQPLETRDVFLVTQRRGERAYVLGRAPGTVRIKDVLDAIRRYSADRRFSEAESAAMALWTALDQWTDRAPDNVSLVQALQGTENDGRADRPGMEPEAPSAPYEDRSV